MKVWRDYRITIPVEVRRKLGLHPGTEVDFIDFGDSIGIVKRKPTASKSTRGKKVVADSVDKKSVDG